MTRRLRWSEEEMSSLFETFSKCSTIEEVVFIHNEKWGNGRTMNGVFGVLRAKNGNCEYSNLLRKVNVVPGAPKETERIVKMCLKGSTLTQICDSLDCSPKRVLEMISTAKSMGYSVALHGDTVNVEVKKQKEISKIDLSEVETTIIIGACADLHYGSKHCQPEAITDFMGRCAKRGVQHIFVAGDILAGQKMYRGQEYELVCSGGTDQANMCAELLPEIDGVQYHMIGGNHDASFLTSSGLDALEYLAQKRPDIVYYGMFNALIEIGKILIEIHHQEGAGAYAASYHLQKDVEALWGARKPDVKINGHTHQSLWMPDYRGVHAFYPASFEGQTSYLKRKHIYPSIGGFIIEIGITETGKIRTIMPEFVSYGEG